MYGELLAPEEGINIHGLFIDAGRWDVTRACLTDALPGIFLCLLVFTINSCLVSNVKQLNSSKHANRSRLFKAATVTLLYQIIK